MTNYNFLSETYKLHVSTFLITVHRDICLPELYLYILVILPLLLTINSFSDNILKKKPIELCGALRLLKFINIGIIRTKTSVRCYMYIMLFKD